MKIALIIPTLNAGSSWQGVLEAIDRQTLQPHRKILLDSQSSDGTVALAREHGFTIYSVARDSFNHGLTRQWGADLARDSELLLYLTQDAMPAEPMAFESLLSAFQEPTVGAAYGRQLPRNGATPLESFLRRHSYPAESRIKTARHIPELGLLTSFCSNSFAIWRKSALAQIGGFQKTDFGEDMLAAARLLQEGFSIAYCAEATAIHSHSLGVRSEYRRNYQIGRMHCQNPWLEASFGRVFVAGKTIVRHLPRFLVHNAFGQIPLLVMVLGAKFSGFYVGKAHAIVGNRLVKWAGHQRRNAKPRHD
jgi:rhamnosyltransferase